MHSYTSRDFTEVSFAEARKQWLSTSGDMAPSDALDLACTLVGTFPRHAFFLAQAIKLAAAQGEKPRVARLILQTAEHEADMPVGPVMTAADTLAHEDVSEVERRNAEILRERFIDASPKRHLFRAISANRAHDPDTARVEVETHLERFPDDKQALVLRGTLAYQSGRWGRYCKDILALKAIEGNARSQNLLDHFENFRMARGLSEATPDEMVRDEEMLETPGAVYEHAMTIAPAPDSSERSGVAMLTGSLAGGGAERIVATTFRRLRALEQDEDTQLWLFSKYHANAGNALFYLPLTGLSEDELTIIGPRQEQDEPFCWLPPFYAARAQGIYDQLIATKPRVLYLTLDEAIIAGGIAAVMAGVPEIIVHCHNMRPPHLHGNDTRSFGWARAYRSLILRPNVKYVNVSQATVDDYRDWCRIPPGEGNMTVIHNGIDFDDIDDGLANNRSEPIKAELNIPPDSPVVGTALRFADVKQPLVWLNAARLIRDAIPGVHFILYGDGALLEEAKALADQLGMGDCVHFPGRVSDLAYRLPVFDVFMLSSRSEGFPNSLVEAQAAGAVPVTFDVGGCRETMAPGRTGIVVYETTDTALAAEVIFLLSDPQRLHDMKESGMAFVRDEFSLEQMSIKMRALVYGTEHEYREDLPSPYQREDDTFADKVRLMLSYVARAFRSPAN